MAECKIEWDYKIDDPIPYFDATKSYEITGYRPITADQGLDFNPDWFRDDAINKLTTGKYSPKNVMVGSKLHVEFWKDRIKRCKEGHISHGYRITGDNYFFLNFYNLKTDVGEDLEQDFSFPSFYVYQYEFFHYKELAEKLDKDTSVLKARGLGLSESAASMFVRIYTLYRNARCLATAFSGSHLNPTVDKMWYQLNWLNENTETAFKRLRQVIDTKTHKRASMKNKDGSENVNSHRSEIEALIGNDIDKLRGDRLRMILYEEAGADSSLDSKWTKGHALVHKMGGQRTGFQLAIGTGGSAKADSMTALATMTNNPWSYNILPVRHNHTATGEWVTTGMFIPAYVVAKGSPPDKRGWTDPVKAKEYYIKEREQYATNPKKLIQHQSEYCFTIDEALFNQESIVFPREELAEQLTQLEIHKNGLKFHRGALVWETVDGSRNGKVKWREDNRGNILLLEHPLISADGNSYNNLYVGGIDSIDIGMNDSATTDISQLSRFCITIKKRTFGTSEPMYVALYLDRPKDVREAYDNAAKLLTYYGCKAVYEASRTTILTYFRNNNLLHLLMKRPRSTLSDAIKNRTNSNMYGAPVPEKTIRHYIELIYEMCLHYSHTLYFKEMIEQLLNYTYENKKKFDIVAAMGMAELGDEELSVKQPVERNAVVNKFNDIGYYIDQFGIKRYGVIPKEPYERIREEDRWLYE